MAVAYEKYGSSNTILVKQSAAAAETITLSGADVNGGNAYTVLGVFIEVITAIAGTVTVSIAGTNIGTALSTAVAGPFIYELSDTFADLQGAAGDDITIVTSAAAKCQVHLLISQAEPSNA
jgi:hypothetical protein